METAIRVENLAKRYRLGEAGSSYRTLRETCMSAVNAPARWLRDRRVASSRTSPDREIWALRGVSFEVKAGEVVGIIGRNGAGKSTLLKVLSQITHPTHGRALLNGRVGSLLEVGTGFHPELTGRENVFLSGAILGMSRRETKRKFDEIVAFAEIERFLDTPVKRYSSGMYTRLAFAVASHLEPEILIVDEVLAVGDAAFQKKCLGRMSNVSREGRTVLFVSHNMSAVKSLCTRGILIEAGRAAYDGSVDVAVNRYLDVNVTTGRSGEIVDDAPRHCDVPGEARIRSVRLADPAGAEVAQLFFGQRFRVGVVCEVLKPIEDAFFEISISTPDGTQITFSTTTDGGVEPMRLDPGLHEVWAECDAILLPREYVIDVGIHHHSNGATCDFVQRTREFTVLRVAERGADHFRWPVTRGLIRAPLRWQVCQQA